MTEDQIKHMVDRFLQWRLPENFHPDAGITFKAEYNDSPEVMAMLGTDKPSRHQPVGTNLFSGEQATAMVRHMIEGLAGGFTWVNRTLYFNGRQLGMVIGINNEGDQYETEIAWDYWLGLGGEDNQRFATQDEARAALEAAAKAWLFPGGTRDPLAIVSVPDNWVPRWKSVPWMMTEDMQKHFKLSLHMGGSFLDAWQSALAATPALPDHGWRDISTAPKDGTMILAWCVHPNAAYSKDPVAEGWACATVTHWIDHNGGGWTWHGLCGAFSHWRPLPPSPKNERSESACPAPPTVQGQKPLSNHPSKPGEEGR